ncbi:hypothetical protein Tco_0218342 [Tanacetum coccineum]
MLAICNANEPVAFKALKTSSKTEKKDPKGQSLELHLDIGNNFQFLKIGNQNQPLASTLVVDGMHKEVHQATSGPTSLGVTGEEGADPQLSSDNDALAAFTYEVDLDKSVPKDLLSQKQGNDEGTQNISFDHIVVELTSFDDVTRVIKLEDLSKLVKDINIDITELDSLEDDQPFMVENDEDEEVHVEPNAKAEDTLLEKAQAEELCTRLNLHFQMLNNSLSYCEGIKHYVEELEIEIPGDLKEIPKKLEEFQYFVSALTKQVAKLKNLKLEVQVGLLALQGQANEEESKSDSETEVRLIGSLVESFKQKHLKKFAYVNEHGESFLITEEDIRK